MKITKHLSEVEKKEFVQIFEKDDSGYFITWVVDSIQKRTAYIESRSNNKSGRKSKSKEQIISESYEKHMENKYEYENKYKEEIKDKDKIPTEDEFLEHCKVVCQTKFDSLEFSLRSKYKTWVDDGWKDGNGKRIKNWKNKINNTIPFLKPIQHDKQIRKGQPDTDDVVNWAHRILSGENNSGRVEE